MPHPEYLFFQGPLLFSPVWECGHGEASILRGLVLYIPALAERSSCAVLQCVLSRVIQDLLFKIITPFPAEGFSLSLSILARLCDLWDLSFPTNQGLYPRLLPWTHRVKTPFSLSVVSHITTHCWWLNPLPLHYISFLFYWIIVDLQYCVNFFCTAKWLSTHKHTVFFIFSSIMVPLSYISFWAHWTQYITHMNRTLQPCGQESSWGSHSLQIMHPKSIGAWATMVLV